MVVTDSIVACGISSVGHVACSDETSVFQSAVAADAFQLFLLFHIVVLYPGNF